MQHATELIRQIIRKQGLHTIYPGRDEASFNDLLQVAWLQIEKTLYKYRARPHCRVCFAPEYPANSILYEPGPVEYGVLSFDDLVKKGVRRCTRCRTQLLPKPVVEPCQDTYGGSETVLFRGISKVFNLWCVAPETMLLTDQGPQTIAKTIECSRAGLEPETFGLGGMTRIVGTITKPERATLRVTVQGNFSVECSPEHGLYTLGSEKPDWREAGKLVRGDLLALQFNQQVFGPPVSLTEFKVQEAARSCELSRRMGWRPETVALKTNKWRCPDFVTVDLAYIIGLLVAEGSISHNQVTIYNVDHEVIRKLHKNKLGVSFKHRPKYQRAYSSNKQFRRLLKWFGFDKGMSADTKMIPQCLLAAPREIILGLLRGLFDGDGHSSRHNGIVGFTSCSKTLIAQVRMLLLNLGLLSKVYSDPRKERRFPKGYVSKLIGAQQLILSATDSCAFYHLVRFGIGRKNAKSKALTPNPRRQLFGLNEHFRALYRKYGTGRLGYNSIRRVLKAAWCTSATANAKLQSWTDHKTDPDYRFIEDRLAELIAVGGSIIWLPIKSIEPSSSRLCEISVKDKSCSYAANGIVSHNSQISRTVILAYIKKEGRDRKNSPQYRTHIDEQTRPESEMIKRFLSEARELFKYNDDFICLLEALEAIWDKDDKPYDGIIGKLAGESGLSRTCVTQFLRAIKLMSHEFTDSPINRQIDPLRSERHRIRHEQFDEGD